MTTLEITVLAIIATLALIIIALRIRKKIRTIRRSREGGGFGCGCGNDDCCAKHSIPPHLRKRR